MCAINEPSQKSQQFLFFPCRVTKIRHKIGTNLLCPYPPELMNRIIAYRHLREACGGGTRDPSQVPTPSTSCPNPLPRAIFRRSGSQVWGGILFGRRCGVLHSLTLTEWFRKENCKIDNSLWSQKLILRKLHIIRSLFAYFSSSPALYPIVRSIPTLFLSFNIFFVND